MRDKSKVLMLITLIIFIVVLIISFSIITYFNIKDENKEIKKTSTTGVVTSETTSAKTNEKIETTTSITTKKEEKVTTPTTTKKIIETTTEQPTETTTENVDIASESILDDWCLKIFNIINDTRKNNNLNEVKLKKDILSLAVDASIKWESIHDDGLKSYLYGYNYYGYQSNILSSFNGYKEIATETLKNTDVGKNKYLNYIGININKVDNKYYFIIIYE